MGLVFVGFTAPVGGSGAVVWGNMLHKARVCYDRQQTNRSFYLSVAVKTRKEVVG